ncbi:MAG: hypothetical protein PHI50_01535 [Alphaproteobacteria bacterium]|nr:hypothetical protein [Alphaproteobacteria bacterium]
MTPRSEILDILSKAEPLSPPRTAEKDIRPLVNVKGHGNIILIGSSGILFILAFIFLCLFFKH